MQADMSKEPDKPKWTIVISPEDAEGIQKLVEEFAAECGVPVSDVVVTICRTKE